MAYQLEFCFDEVSQIELLKTDIEKIKCSSDKVRKGIHAKHGDLMRKYLDLSERLQLLERNICVNSPMK